MTRRVSDQVKIGLLSFSDGRQRVHEGLAPTIQGHQDRLAALIAATGATPVVAEAIAWTPRLAVAEARRLLAADVAAVVFNIPVFAFPNLPALAAAVLERPVAILSPGEANLPGMGGLLAAGGGLVQMGQPPLRLWGPYDSPATRAALESFIRGTGARHRLRGQVYGQIGGRSIGMLTGVSSSPAQWLRVFGVDIDHADQSEILRIAEQIVPAERERIVAWLEGNLRSVAYGESPKLTRETLAFQAACAAAVKRIAEERQFDFIGIKCHFDLSEYYCTQCLSAAFLPGRLDWDGPREPMVCACEADGDGALTMQILQLVSGEPALFMDLRHFDRSENRWTLCNCGGQSIHYARRADDEADNLAAVDLVPVIAKYGGVGAHVRYLGEPGAMTFARLVHDGQGHRLIAFAGQAVKGEDSWLEKSCPQWPHLFAQFPMAPEALLDRLHANHIHAVAGDCTDALAHFARAAGIAFERI